MGAAIQALQEASFNEVEVIGLQWRISRIRSSDLAKVGVAAFALASKNDDETMESSIAALTPEQAEKLASYQEAVVCAGVKQVRPSVDDGWEDVMLMISETRSSPEEGKLWIGSLPAKAITVLFTAIMELSTDEGGAAERLTSFRDAAGLAVNA